MERAYRLRDVAAQLNLSTRTVRRYIAAGRLAATRLPSGHYRVSAQALAALAADTALDAPSAPQRPERPSGEG